MKFLFTLLLPYADLQCCLSVAKALSSDMDGRRSEEKESLHQRYGDLKPRLSEANAHKVEQAMLELQVRWSELCRVIARRTSGEVHTVTMVMRS